MRHNKLALLIVAITLTGTAILCKRLKTIKHGKAGNDKNRKNETDFPVRALRLRDPEEKSKETGETKDERIVTLKDSDGIDVSFEFLDMIGYKGDNYVVLLPYPHNNEPVVILREGGIAPADPGCEVYETVKDQKTLDDVYRIFKFKFKGEFIFSN